MHNITTKIIPVRLSGKVVAKFDTATKTLERNLRGSIHLLRSPLAICFDASIIAQAERLGCKSVEVRDVENGNIYKVSFEEFQAKCFPINRGFGEQLALPLRYWNMEGREIWNSAPAPVRQVMQEENLQPALF